MILEDDLRAFHLENVQCNALEDLVNEHLEENQQMGDVPRNIKEAMKSREAMEAAQKEIEMIQKFGTWKLVHPS